MVDYTIYYKQELPTTGPWGSDGTWDLLISAYVPSDRTRRVFDEANAAEKRWLVFSEYAYDKGVIPSGNTFQCDAEDEAEYVSRFWSTLRNDTAASRICIDITGFIRPYLMFLIRWLVEKGVRKFDALYAEPVQYQGRELTEFSGVVKEIRQVNGFEGIHVPDISNDVLIIGAGYEDSLISHVAENKAKARKLQLIGFPSLRADMYQENMLRVRRAEEALGGSVNDQLHTFFAPANDPFVAAREMSRVVEDLKRRNRLTNLYLSPLSTKAHVLGFVLFYLTECRNTASSVIFPFEEKYSQNTSRGLARVWKYSVELPASTR